MKRIYLDNNSTTKIDERVFEAMLPFLTEHYGNPSSTEHAFGWKANDSVNVSREHISDLINCSPNEIIFTSGATESNNISILGVLERYKNQKKHAITVNTEHKSILDIFNYIEKNNTSTTYLDVQKNGIIDINQLEDSINDTTRLISVMLANNEIGVLQPIHKISQICRKQGIIFHVDAAQALGKIHINLNETKIDLMSFSSHKIYGPKGIGCIYLNRETMKNKIAPIIFGGDHERGLRPGTLSLHNIVGFGKACRISKKDIDKDINKINELRDLMIANLMTHLPDMRINGDVSKRISGNLNVSFPGLVEKTLLKNLKKIAVSSGSACTSASPTPSHVLKAIGLDDSLIDSTIRIGIGRFNTEKEIKEASKYIIKIITKLKN